MTRPETTVGVGERPRARLCDCQFARDLADDRQEDLFAEQARVVEVAVVDSRRRRGSDRGMDASASRARRVRLLRRRPPTARTPRLPRRSALRIPYPVRAGARRMRRRRRSAPSRRPPRRRRRSAHPSPSASIPPTRSPRPRTESRARRRGTRSSALPRTAAGSFPRTGRRRWRRRRPRRASARFAASQPSVSVSSSGAQIAIRPRPPRPQAAPTSAAREAQVGRGRADTQHSDGHRNAPGGVRYGGGL